MSEKRYTCSKLLSIVFGAACFLLLLPTAVQGQNWSNLDSLEQAYIQGAYEDEQELTILNQLTRQHENLDKKVFYSSKLINLSIEKDSIDKQFDAYIARGHAQSTRGEYSQALEDYFSASKIANETGDKAYGAIVNLAIAGGYSRLEDYHRAIEYYKKAEDYYRTSSTENAKVNKINLGYTLFNMGEQYLDIEKPDSALLYFDQASPIFEEEEDQMGQAYTQGSQGKAYAMLGREDLALDKMKLAIEELINLNNFFEAVSEFQLAVSTIYLQKAELESAEYYAQLSLETSEKHQLKSEMRDANLMLSKIYDAKNEKDLALNHFHNYVQLKDSLINIKTVRQLADMRTDFEIAQKQLEVDLLNTQKRTQRVIMYSLGLFLLLAVIFYRRISKEKSRSDLLLLNILPSKTAAELKEKGKVKARKFEAVTVMFTDFEAFTQHSQNLTPEKLVKSVDFFFSAFDKIIEKYHLEKIKTIGDAYMCTGGLIRKGPLEPVKVIHAAFEIIDFVQKSRKSDVEDIAHFKIRIGINTGPVVGGVVGTKKFAYDIWGDTVNVAARMETNSQAGRINISENTYQLVKDEFECEYRGEIDVKNKGMMKMYFVHGPKKALNSHNRLKGEDQTLSRQIGSDQLSTS